MTQQNAQSTSEPIISENDLIAQRHAKLKQIKESAKQAGTSPWPNTFKREHYAGDLQEQFKDLDKAEIEAGEHVYVKVAGRVMLNRGSFIVIQDMTGRIQLYVDRKGLPADTLEPLNLWI
jgi:lysyl-tRNA synthetase class 2